MGWGFDRDKFVQLLQEDDEIRGLIRQIASRVPEERGRSHAWGVPF